MIATLDLPLTHQFVTACAEMAWDVTILTLAVFAPIIGGTVLFALALLWGIR